MIMPRFGLEVMTTTPFTHKLRDRWGREDYSLGKFSRMSPTISGQYFFLKPKSRFQPYVGLGLNYTRFYNEKLSSSAVADFNGGSDLEMKDSIGLTVQAGIDYKIGSNFVLNAAVWRMGMSSTVRWKGDNGGTRYKADVDIDPWVYSVGVGYIF
jgi:outer membrane protein